MERVKSEVTEELKAKMRELKEAGKFPRGYAQKVVDRLKEKGVDISVSSVRHVADGKFINQDIIEELLNLAHESWEHKQLERAKKLLNKK